MDLSWEIKTNYPVIFLDFDGVLNSIQSRIRNPSGWNQLDPVLVGRVNRIIEATGASVVVSSTWRLSYRNDAEGAVVRLGRILRENGFVGEVIDVTPHYNGGGRFRSRMSRGLEIQFWMDKKGFDGPFVILDDDSDMGHLMGFLVHTKDALGIQDEHVDDAINIIKNGEREWKGERNKAIQSFVNQILHGDEAHCKWLKDAAEAFTFGRPMPPLPGKPPLTKCEHDRFDGLFCHKCPGGFATPNVNSDF